MKRLVCVLLTLIMVMSMVPVSASAAAFSTSESAITILKQLEGYSTTCDAKGYTGYGTLCTEKGTHGAHKTNEKLADAALREKLKELDKAINTFASKKGVALTQNKHDALVLFSFQNGTAWTTGTGDFQAAVASGKTGSDFLNAICRWDTVKDDDSRRMIEANIYLNGIYSSTRPSNFICVYFHPNYNAYELPDGEWEVIYGDINQNTSFQYYDVSNKPAPHLNPTMDYHTFTGWYVYTEYGWSRVTNLTAAHHDELLVAGWVPNYSEPGTTNVSYVLNVSQLLSEKVYYLNQTTGKFGAVVKETVSQYCFSEDSLWVDSDYLAEDGTRWCRIQGADRWVKVSMDAKSSAQTAVTVTNSYVRCRAEASIYSKQVGTFNQGQKLIIAGTAEKDGFLWGKVVKSETDSTVVGWVALMYTNYESVINANTSYNNTNAIATAVITYNGYVNVRSDAGTHNKIVSALPQGTEVSLYETKFVNGLEWGRCSTGWFCLSYASVKRLTVNNHTNDIGFTSYAFTGTVDPSSVEIYEKPSTSANHIFTRQYIDPKVTVTNLVSAEGMTWGKIAEGWIRVTDNTTFQAIDAELDAAKFSVIAASVTVRTDPQTSASRVDSLVKGVEFNVNETNQVIVAGDSVWGYATKVGEGNKTYAGWVNLATKSVTRSDAPALDNNNESSGNAVSGTLMATVIGANNLKVRSYGAMYGTVIGSLSNGTTVRVWEANEDESWYKVDSNKNGVYDYEEDGWVSANYLNIQEGTSNGTTSNGGASNGTGTVETGTGVVANTYSGVNVRQGAGTGYALVGKLLPGTAVEILEVKTVGATKWGRTSQGWVSMDYITMVSNYPISGTTGNAGTTGSDITSSESAIYTGTAKGAVTIYKETSTNSDSVRELSAGDPITMHEILTVTEKVQSSTSTNEQGSTTTTVEVTSYWARVNDGYIYAPGENINLDTLDEYTYTVTGAETLNVRNAAGTNGTSVQYKLAKGDQVTITELQIVNGNVWGKVESEGEKGELLTGWASLSYMTKGAITIQNNNQNNNSGNNTNTGTTMPPAGMGNGSDVGGFVTNTSGYRYTGTVIRSNEVNVRASHSTDAAKTTTLKKGAALVIYETVTVDGMAWGRCDAGWIYLYYVDLVPVTGGVDARVVANDNTIIYTDMNGSAVAGTYAKQSVIDIFEIVGKMARTELGWVSTDSLL